MRISIRFKILAGMLACLGFVLAACDGGLEPPPRTILAGKIIYKGGKDSWPPADSVKDIRVVAFRDYPPKDIVSEVLSGNAYYTQAALPFFVDSCNFEFEIPKAPVDIKYIAVAWQFGGIFDWKAIGVYTTTGDPANPAALHFDKGTSRNITINVDFKNLPPQPFVK